MTKLIDRRRARTEKALHGALMSLIVSKGYEAITVQDIIDAADVGRSTFYAHYTSKEDLLRSGFATLREDLERARLAAGSANGGPLAFSLAFLEHVNQYRHIYRSLLGARGRTVADQELRRVLTETVEKDLSGSEEDATVPRELRVQFVVDTFLSVVGWWFERKRKAQPAEMDAIFRGLVFDGIGSTLLRT
jgi:AcrR family transcriptional regulator